MIWPMRRTTGMTHIDPYCFMHTIKEDGSCFVAGFTTPNLIRNARRGRGEDYLSIDGQFSITVEGFTMQIVGTCDRAQHLLPLCQWHVWGLCIGSLSPKHLHLSYAGCSGLGRGVFMQCPHPCGFCINTFAVCAATAE